MSYGQFTSVFGSFTLLKTYCLKVTLPTGARLVVRETADSKVNLFFYPSPLDRQLTLGKYIDSGLSVGRLFYAVI